MKIDIYSSKTTWILSTYLKYYKLDVWVIGLLFIARGVIIEEFRKRYKLTNLYRSKFWFSV